MYWNAICSMLLELYMTIPNSVSYCINKEETVIYIYIPDTQ